MTRHVPRCSNEAEFLEALTAELESDNPGVIPGDYTGYLRRCFKWQDEGGNDVHEKCADLGDYNSLEKELEETKAKVEKLEADLEERRCEVETLNDRLLDFEDTTPLPNVLRAAARDAVQSMRALLPQLDAPKMTPATKQRVRMLLALAANALESATRKTEDEPEEQTEPAPVWYPVTCKVDGEDVPFRWQREPIRAPLGTVIGHITRIAWAPCEGVGAEVAKSRWYSGNTAATLQVWQGGEEAIADDDDRATLYAQAAMLEAALPEA